MILQNLIFAAISGSVIPTICWLIDRKDERAFCKTANKRQNENYIQLQKTKRKRNIFQPYSNKKSQPKREQIIDD